MFNCHHYLFPEKKCFWVIFGYFDGYSDILRLRIAWATIIHESRNREGGGVSFLDLQIRTMDDASSYAGLQLLFTRLFSPLVKRSGRKSYEYALRVSF